MVKIELVQIRAWSTDCQSIEKITLNTSGWPIVWQRSVNFPQIQSSIQNDEFQINIPSLDKVLKETFWPGPTAKLFFSKTIPEL